LLTITLNPQLSTIIISWPVTETTWELQGTTNLGGAGTVWTPHAYVTNGANCTYIESPPTGNRFYRLKKP
jgi:hypothetical protein